MLFEKAADSWLPPASLAKLMTAEVVFNEIKRRQRQARRGIHRQRERLAQGRRAVRRLDHVRADPQPDQGVGPAAAASIIQSGNDACIALAEGIAGNEDSFARLMNGRARELGLTEIELHQFDRAARSGAAGDGARAWPSSRATSSAPIPNTTSWYGEREFTWNKIRQQNRNPLLAMNIGADGMKTGFTKEAGYGLVGSAVQNDLRLIVVVNGLKIAKERADEAQAAAEWGFNGFESRMLFAEGQTVGEAQRVRRRAALRAAGAAGARSRSG